MKKDRSWSNWLDPEKVQKGNYTLYRNYIENGQFIYYPDSKEKEDYIGHTTPVALGITAFLVGDDHGSDYVKCFLAKGKKFDTKQTYSLYFNGCLSEFMTGRKSLPFPQKDEELRQSFLLQHIDNEREYYLLSDKYFTECRDESDRMINETIREYVKGYFAWLESLVKENTSSDLSGSRKTIIAESIVIKLWEEYGSSFPTETKDMWRERWVDDGTVLDPILISHFEHGNSKHLLLAILNEARPVYIN